MGEPTEPEIEALIADFYAAFDNRGARQPRGRELRAMFLDSATITRVGVNGVETWMPDAFIEPRVTMLTDGTLTEFHEWETEARTILLRGIASRWSSYRKDGRLNGAEARGGGQKFIQLCRTGGRWMIASILWEDGPQAAS